MGKMCPPIIEPTTAAFFGSSLSVPFSVNRAVVLSEVKKIYLIIKSTITNEQILKTSTTTFSNNKATFIVNSPQLQAGGFYKIQIAFAPKNPEDYSGFEVGYYSSVSIVKYMGKEGPSITIQNDVSNNNMIIGKYINKEDLTEKLYSYSFVLRDGAGNIVEETGEKLHNSSADAGPEQQDTWVPSIALTSGYKYTVDYQITTINGFQTSRTQVITAQKDDSGYVPRNIQLLAHMNEENGYVDITIKSTISAISRQLIYGKFRIYRVSSKDGFKNRYLVAYFSLENQDLFGKSFKDFTVESGFKYRYILQQVNDYGIHSEEVWSQGDVECNYEHLFLYDGKRQLKIKYNPKVPSFKNTVLESKVDTIGGKYPFIFRNENVMYKELSLSGLISYKMDEQNLFLNDSDIWPYLDEGLSGKEKWTHNLTYDNITAEREFKLRVLSWLNDGEIKLLKSPTEGNYIIRLLNVSLAPTDSLGRILHTFSATAYEVDDVNKYQFTKALTIDKTYRYIGYKTTPLYDFPTSRLLTKNKVETDYTKYEIILNPHLEFVTGVHFEDVKPMTRFEVALERKGEEMIHKFAVGATGFYAIPSELGFHIKRIRLESPHWETGDYGFDIINNRGQVTYEFERQAKHNNFNDITKIESDILIGAPMNSSYALARISEPLTTVDDQPIYEYKIVASEEALVEVGYFYTEDEQPDISEKDKDTIKANYFKLRGKDYVFKEDGKYYDMKGTELHPFVDAYWQDKPLGLYYSYGMVVPALDTVENPTLDIEDKNQYHDFKATSPNIYILDNENETIQITGKDGEKTLLFVRTYDSRGVEIIKKTVDEPNGYIQNPYCSYCSKSGDMDQGGYFKKPIFVDLYKTVPVTSITEGRTEESSDMGIQKIYRNYVTNKYYNATNSDGEYYIKEEIQNIYNLSFELVPVFYESNFEDNEVYQEEKEKGVIKKSSPIVSYDDIEENNGYTHIRRLSNLAFKYDKVLEQTEMYYDYIDPDLFGTVREYINPSWLKVKDIQYTDDLSKLYKIPQGENFLNYFYANPSKFTLYERVKTNAVMGVYKYNKIININEKIKNLNDSTKKEYLDSLYLNPKYQGYDNYIEATTPTDSEVVIVYTDNPNHIEHIDLADRLSYNISAEDFGQEDLNNIAAVYIGKCVRGFITYKRKRYSYRAILEDGLVVDLEPDEKIIKD